MQGGMWDAGWRDFRIEQSETRAFHDLSRTFLPPGRLEEARGSRSLGRRTIVHLINMCIGGCVACFPCHNSAIQSEGFCESDVTVPAASDWRRMRASPGSLTCFGFVSRPNSEARWRSATQPSFHTALSAFSLQISTCECRNFHPGDASGYLLFFCSSPSPRASDCSARFARISLCFWIYIRRPCLALSLFVRLSRSGHLCLRDRLGMWICSFTCVYLSLSILFCLSLLRFICSTHPLSLPPSLSLAHSLSLSLPLPLSLVTRKHSLEEGDEVF